MIPDVSRTKLLQAIEEYDTLGRETCSTGTLTKVSR